MSLEKDDVAEDITMVFGPAWVLVSVPSVGDDGFDVSVQVGPMLDANLTKKVLSETLRALEMTG